MKIFKKIYQIFAALCVFSVFGGLTALCIYAGEVRLIIDEDTEYEAIEGFGVSAAWWAKYFGNSGAVVDGEPVSDYVARMLYNEESGIGLDTYRYNIGAGSKDQPGVSFSETRQTESFYYFDASLGKYTYDFSRDAASMSMLDAAVRQNPKLGIVLFSNSPHFSMTKNGSASGDLAGKSNLSPDKFGEYANYLVTITKHFIDSGYNIIGLSPINEPQWKWGREGNIHQEGCHYEPKEALNLSIVVAEKMKAAGIDFGKTKLVFLEDGRVGHTKGISLYRNALAENLFLREATGNIYTAHSYAYDFRMGLKTLAEYRARAKDKNLKIALSEWCELPSVTDSRSTQAGLNLLRVMQSDFDIYKPISWEAWVAVNEWGDYRGEPRGDGFFVADFADLSTITTSGRFYAMGHFSKFVNPGDIHIKSHITNPIKSDELYSTAFKTAAGTVVIISNNTGRRVNIKFPTNYSNITVYKTDGVLQLDTVYSGGLNAYLSMGEGYKFEADSKSIYTIILN